MLDVATRTMNLRLELPNPHRKLKPEMYATIRVHSLPELGVLIVPEGAVQRERDRRFVFVQRDAQTFEARDVTLGEGNGEMIKILDGLQEGEPVVVKGAAPPPVTGGEENNVKVMVFAPCWPDFARLEYSVLRYDALP